MPPTTRICTHLTATAIPRAYRSSRICVASLSHSAIRPDESAKAGSEPAEETKKSDEKQRTENGRKPTRFAIPALAFFGVAVPLGWYLKTRWEQKRSPAFASPAEFVKYTLVGKDSVSSTCAIFRLKPSSNITLDLCNPELERAITSVEIKQPQLQIARSYTCLPQQDGQHEDELRFLIRREQKGEVSNFLHRLPVGSDIEVRGLLSEYTLPDNVKSVLFLVGGTGIAPAMQLADALEGEADVHILWANRRREDCIGGYNDKIPTKSSWSWWSKTNNSPATAGQENADAEKGALVSMLQSLKKQSASSESRVLVDYYVDEEGTQISTQDVKTALNALSQAGSSDETAKKFLFVSGPPGFISHWAGAKRWANGREVQGPLGGIISTMNLRGWKVVKL